MIASAIARNAGAFQTAAMTTHPMDRLLLAKGRLKCAKKLGEEAIETCLAAVAQDKAALANESAALLYHLLVLWTACDLTPEEVYAALSAREGRSGLEEKAARKD